ncbi:uncharacterized protein LOC110278883 isoform X2 [Arachis duranensis]|uniref:Uncharacterized protein LOC110278883 isoform X2 n=1 Tax=Arachis duranensis TaxID=130453 RepID=A0A9C6TU62_ARADU|nr:uncharacterized protein LOC110278883 isoform X2 [Arachis duranensis]
MNEHTEERREDRRELERSLEEAPKQPSLVAVPQCPATAAALASAQRRPCSSPIRLLFGQLLRLFFGQPLFELRSPLFSPLRRVFEPLFSLCSAAFQPPFRHCLPPFSHLRRDLKLLPFPVLFEFQNCSILRGMRVMEFISVTNVDGLSRIHIQVPSTGVLTRRSVEPLKVTSYVPPRNNLAQTAQMMDMVLMMIKNPQVMSGPEVLNIGNKEKDDSGIGDKINRSEDEVFSDAIADFSDSQGVKKSLQEGSLDSSTSVEWDGKDDPKFSGSSKDSDFNVEECNGRKQKFAILAMDLQQE